MNFWFLAALSVTAGSDGWSNLKHVTHDRPYAVVLRDGQCQYGTLSSVGDQALVLGAYSGLGILIKRSQVMRVTDNPTEPSLGAIFSGRSSWRDVKATTPKTTEYFHIVTKGGEEWKWKQPAVSADSITFGRVTIAKPDVRYIFYVRFKPLTVDEEFLHQDDLKWLVSIPWVSDLAARKISVLLYNSDLPEDNSPVTCH
jgi:hypothetical protein